VVKVLKLRRGGERVSGIVPIVRKTRVLQGLRGENRRRTRRDVRVGFIPPVGDRASDFGGQRRVEVEEECGESAEQMLVCDPASLLTEGEAITVGGEDDTAFRSSAHRPMCRCADQI
jgi:hypothetical protein